MYVDVTRLSSVPASLGACLGRVREPIVAASTRPPSNEHQGTSEFETILFHALVALEVSAVQDKLGGRCNDWFVHNLRTQTKSKYHTYVRMDD